MGALEGNFSRNSDGSTFGASAVGWSPYDQWRDRLRGIRRYRLTNGKFTYSLTEAWRDFINHGLKQED